jgi:hypothetical protein
MARRFSEAERTEIWERLAQGESGSMVARVFGRFPSAIYAVQRLPAPPDIHRAVGGF